MSSYAYWITKCVLTLALAVPGSLMLGHALGVITLPDGIRFSHVNGADKFAGAGALLGLPDVGVMALIGTCKLSAVVAFWTNLFGLEQLATLLVAVLYACVAVGHYQIDGDFAGPVVLGVAALVKLFCKPAASKKAKASTA